MSDGYMEDGYFSYDTILSPLTSSTANSSLQDLDPALFKAIDFFKNIINVHAGLRWNAEATLCRPDLVGKVINQVLPYDATPFPQQNQFRFPLLMVYRTDEAYEWKTIAWDHITSHFDVVYILPPLEVEAAERLMPFLSFTAKALLERTKQGKDTFINSGEQYWKEAGVEEIGFESATYGKVPLVVKSDIKFPVLHMRLKVVERLMPVTNQPPSQYGNFTGYDLDVQTNDPANPPVVDGVAQVKGNF